MNELYNSVWNSVLEELEVVYSEDTFHEVFEPLESIARVDKNLVYI